MDNQRLLKKYKIKLSIYFALFVMFSLYIIQIIFLWVQFISNNIDLKNTLLTKISGIENVLKNKQEYYSQIESQDVTLQKLILKTLENSIVYKWWEKIIDFWNTNITIWSQRWVINTNQKKYIIEEKQIQKEDYIIVVYAFNPYNFDFFLHQLVFYFVILSPFFVFFYFIWYFFVNRNFRVIEQSIHSLEDFTSNVNHEMKTPLSEIISTLSLAQKIKNYQEAVDISLASAERLNKILDSIIGMSNLSDIAYRKEKVDILKELDMLLQDFQKDIGAKKLHIKTDLHHHGAILKANKEHVYLCIKNILSNAIKYSKDSGNIEIYFSHGKLVIKDYGVGIDKNNLKKIFERYFRESYTTQEGFWLWLALVKKVTDINHWKLEVESEKDRFTQVTLNFI